MQKMYSVEAIIDKKFNPRSKKPQYLVKWQGWDSNFNTWEPYDHLSDYCVSMIEQFQQKLKTLENTSLNFQSSDKREARKKSQINSLRKRKPLKKMRRNSKINKFSHNKQSNSEKDNEFRSEQYSKNESMMDEQNQEEIEIKQIQNKKKSEVFQRQNLNHEVETFKHKQNSQNNQENSDVSPIEIGAIKYPIVLNLSKNSEMQQIQHNPTEQKYNSNSQTQNKYSKGFQRVNRNNQMQQKQPINIFGSKQQISSKNGISQSKSIFTPFKTQGEQRHKQTSKPRIGKEQKKEVQTSLIQKSEKENIQVLGLRNSKGVLQFYVQIQNGIHKRIWKSHEQMLTNYSRELCHFYEQNIDFQ